MKKLFVLVAVIAVASFAVSASANVGLRAVGIDAGYISPENMDGTWTVGMSLDIGVPITNLYIQPFGNYWSQSITEELTSTEVSFSDMAFGGRVKYVIPTAQANIQPFIGAGAGAHWLKSEVSGVPLLGDLSVTDVKVGYDLGGGLQVGVNERVNVVGQGWYTMIEDFNMWSLRGGVSINL